MAKKTKNILVIENDSHNRQLVQQPLENEGFKVFTAADAPDGLRMARQEDPDLIITAFALPSMKGTEICKTIRRDPATHTIRLLMIVDENQLERVAVGSKSSADDFLITPFTSADLVAKVKPLVINPDDDDRRLISTGNHDLDVKMGGGIPVGSLTLIEGDSGAGKSVLSQQMMHGCLADGYRLSIFSSENTVKSLVRQMQSLNLSILDYLLLGIVRIVPIETSHLGRDAPEILIKAIRKEQGRSMIFIDSLTSSIPQSSDKEVLGFFEECKRLCGSGTTIMTIVHSHGLSRELLTRIRSLCDAHLQLRTEVVGSKLVKTLEVTKVRGAEQTTGNIVSFEVEPGWGIRVIPISKVKG